MGLNISKGDMYDWITHTWNTIKGECPHGCTYCYMKRFGAQKPVHFDRKELKTDLGHDNFIFVGSSCDMWAEGINEDWIIDTLAHCNKYDNHYLFQSKDPIGIWYYRSRIPPKSVFCTTIETNRVYRDIMAHSPSPSSRATSMSMLENADRYVTIEPIIDFDLEPMVELIKQCEPIQVNIGADSGNNHLPEPSMDKVLKLIDELRKFTHIAQKRNLNRLIKEQ